MVMMSRTRRLRVWTVASLLAAASLRCGGDNVRTTDPTDIEMASGNGQNGVVGQPLASPLVVLVTDANGNPVPDVGVQWSAQGGGSVSSQSSTTGSNGRASVQRTLGTDLGEQTTTATVSGLQGSPVTFVSIAVEAGAPGSIVITTNPPISALDAEVFDPAAQPAVQVRDVSGIPLRDITVTATASGSGTLEGTTTATTDAAGTAAFGDLGIRGTGSHTLVFTAGTVTVSSSPVEVTALSTQATTGSWSPLVKWDIVPLHMNLMPNGKIIAWGKYEANTTTMAMPRIWDPSTGAPAGAPMIQLDTMLFCAGHILMPDGRLMVAGGHKADDVGINRTNFFTQDGAWQPAANMAHGRWYPTLTVLPDGRILTMAGRDENGNVVEIPEIWEGNNHWVELPGATGTEIPYYPRNFVAPNGRIFMAGERVQSRWFDVDVSGASGRGVWTLGPTHVWPFNRDYGTAAMYEPGKILYAGGGGHTGWPTPDRKSAAPTATAETIDLNQPTPRWQNIAPMSAPRRHLNSTILPDGQVLITGGTRGGGFVDINEVDAVKTAEVWDPKTGQWTTLAPASKMRVYHSVSLLLPDATVLHGASGDADAFQGGVLTPVPPERNHEIFSPPYLFKGARPTITSVSPSTIGYNGVVSVATPNAAQVTEVRWIHLGAVTHAFDFGQRANTLTFTRTATGVDVTVPANANLAPPGYYQLFILNRNSVPSKGQVIKIQ
jgi:galactose oxidase-like protein/Big-like domain-containing protein/Kelch motif protein